MKCATTAPPGTPANRAKAGGDGVVKSSVEQCDDAKLDGSYDGFAKGCVLGPRCGDGIVQSADGEECDDKNRKNGDGCDANYEKKKVS
jgi:cysteine-rich repeat protein